MVGLKTKVIDGSVKKLTSVKQHYAALIHDYIIDGKKYKRYQVVDMILDILKDENKTIPEIHKEINIELKVLRNLIRYMRDANIISNTGKKRGDFFLFEIYRDCLLANLLIGTPQDVVKKFKVKGRRTRKMEDAPNISSGTKNNNFAYTDHHLNSIYYVNGD